MELIIRKENYLVVFTRHAMIRARQRRIPPEMIKECIKTGEMIRFGRNRIKFRKSFRQYAIVCVDEIAGNEINIVTIEKN